VAFVGKDKENWGQIQALINRLDCEQIFLVKDKDVEDSLKNNKTEIVNINSSAPLMELKQEIMQKLKGKLRGELEVSVSIASGNGKEHMALISALLSIPVGIRFVVFTQKGIEFIN